MYVQHYSEAVWEINCNCLWKL